MQDEQEIKVGSEALLDGVVWVIVEEVYGKEFVCIDQDGGDHVVFADRLDLIA